MFPILTLLAINMLNVKSKISIPLNYDNIFEWLEAN